MSAIRIEAENLTKKYGEVTAVDDLTFSVKPGVVTGFLGPNGAGKSTTMRLILGLDAPFRSASMEHFRHGEGSGSSPPPWLQSRSVRRHSREPRTRRSRRHRQRPPSTSP